MVAAGEGLMVFARGSGSLQRMRFFRLRVLLSLLASVTPGVIGYDLGHNTGITDPRTARSKDNRDEL